jgi:hypothetical protein
VARDLKINPRQLAKSGVLDSPRTLRDWTSLDEYGPRLPPGATMLDRACRWPPLLRAERGYSSSMLARDTRTAGSEGCRTVATAFLIAAELILSACTSSSPPTDDVAKSANHNSPTTTTSPESPTPEAASNFDTDQGLLTALAGALLTTDFQDKISEIGWTPFDGGGAGLSIATGHTGPDDPDFVDYSFKDGHLEGGGKAYEWRSGGAGGGESAVMTATELSNGIPNIVTARDEAAAYAGTAGLKLMESGTVYATGDGPKIAFDLLDESDWKTDGASACSIAELQRRYSLASGTLLEQDEVSTIWAGGHLLESGACAPNLRYYDGPRDAVVFQPPMDPVAAAEAAQTAADFVQSWASGNTALALAISTDTVHAAMEQLPRPSGDYTCEASGRTLECSLEATVGMRIQITVEQPTGPGRPWWITSAGETK